MNGKEGRAKPIQLTLSLEFTFLVHLRESQSEVSGTYILKNIREKNAISIIMETCIKLNVAKSFLLFLLPTLMLNLVSF